MCAAIVHVPACSFYNISKTSLHVNKYFIPSFSQIQNSYVVIYKFM